jgi:predicted MPP superfamily phosphohydrolase
MKRCRASCGILVCLFAFIVDNSAPALPLYTVSSTPYEVIITIKDYPDSLRILQITDSHISRLPLPDDEMQYAAYARRMNAAYNAKDSVLHFEKIVHVAVKGRYDFIALTGDIINNPSRVSLLYVKSAVDATNIPYFYISGNHDWNYEGLSTDIVSQRDEWQKKVLYPLYSEKNPLFYSSIIKGIKFILKPYKKNERQDQIHGV